MMRPMYTNGYRRDLLDKLPDPHRPITAEEHAFLSEQQFGEKFSSREALVEWYDRENGGKRSAADFAAEEARRVGARTLVSLGAGPSVLEMRLARALPDCRVVAADYDEFFVAKGRTLFPELTMARFDFATDDPRKLFNELGRPADMAVFFGSSYVMDDARFAAVFESLAGGGGREDHH